ncbi:MAG: prolipoprotein diacylglyceryl transferase [Alphaproteobacteria bacterium]
MLLAIPFPALDPVAFEVGPISIRWYALAYIVGLILGWRYLRVTTSWVPRVLDVKSVDDFFLWAIFGIIFGGRLGYVLFYKPLYFLENPAEIVAIWRGGMSFHGGLLGMVLVIALFAHIRRIPILALADRVACVVPIGLFFGRIANFINGELFGRPSDAPWAIIFPSGGSSPRHPSQLYEAVFEGVILFLLLWLLSRSERFRMRFGFLTGVFLCGYAIFRSAAELFREPDAHIGFLAGGVTMGQILSLPLFLTGLVLLARRRRSS